MSYNKANLSFKKPNSKDSPKKDMIGYLPFWADKSTFQRYKKAYPELLIYCEEPKIGISSNIPIKNLEFVCINNGLSIGKRDDK